MINAIRADFLFSKGQKEAKTGEWEKSIAFFDRAISFNPKSSRIYLRKALSLARYNRSSEALDAIRKAVALRPDNSANYLFQGVMLFDLGEFDPALVSFEKGLELSPGNSLLKCYIALTMVYKHESISDAHELLLSEILNSNSEFKSRFLVFCEKYLLEHKKIANSLDDIYFAESNFKANESQINFLTPITDKLNIFYIQLSGIFNQNKKKHYLHLFFAGQKLRIKDLAGAIKELKKSMSYSHGLNEATNTLINIYFFQKDFQSVYDIFNRLPEFRNVKKWSLDLVSNPDEIEQIPPGLKNNLSLALELSRYYFHIGEYRRAVDIYRFITYYFINDFDNNYHLGLSYLGLGDNEKALDSFRLSFQHLHHRAAKIRLEEMIRVHRIVSGNPQT